MGIHRVNLDITYRCNAGCIHCSRDANSMMLSELKEDDWKKVIEESADILPKEGASFIVQGGEPTISSSFFPIIEQIRKFYPATTTGPYLSASQVATLNYSKRNMLSMATNGILLEDVMYDLKKYGIENVRVSLDGATENTNDQIRIGVKLENLKKAIKKASQILPIQIATVVMNRNRGEICDILELSRDLGVYSVRLTPLRPAGRGGEIKEDLVSEEGYVSLVHDVQKKLQKMGASAPFVSIGCPAPYAGKIISALDLKLDSRKICTDSPLGLSIHRCYAFGDELTINPYGDVTGCCYMGRLKDFYVGNVKESSIEEIVKSKTFKDMQARRANIRGCLDCEDNFCNGKCMIYEDKNPFCNKNGK